MGRTKKPNITFTNPREITPPGDVVGRIRSLDSKLRQADDLILDLKSAGSEIYDSLDVPILSGLDDIKRDQEISESTQAMTDLLGVLGKTRFLKAIIEAGQKDIIESGVDLFIPVIGSEDVRKAISRTFPNSSTNHDKIYWNMWVEAVRHKVRQSEFVGSEMLEAMTGNSNQDGEILDDTLKIAELKLSQAVQQRNIQQDGNPNGGLGPSLADREGVIKTMEQSANAEELKSLLVYGASLIILYFLNRKLALWKASEAQKIAVASTAYPSPAGIGVMIIQIIVGLALHFIIEGLLAEDVETVMAGIDIPGVTDDDKKDITQAAKELAGGHTATVGPLKGKDINHPEVKAVIGFKDGVLDTVKSYFYRGDYDIIYDYGASWLAANATTLKSGKDFSQWLILTDVESIEYDLENSTTEAPNYSPQYFENAVATKQEPKDVTPVSRSIDAEYTNFIQEVAGVNQQITNENAIQKVLKDKFDPNDMLDDILESMQNQACQYNTVIDQLAGFLTNDPFIASSICCFVRYFGAVDLKLLIALRAVLLIFSRGLMFDLGGFLNSMSSSLNDDLIRKARTMLIARVNKTFSKIFNETMDWADSESLDFLLTCLPIEGLVKFMVATVEDMELELSELIDGLAESISFQQMTLDSKISILQEGKWAKGLYEIVNAIIKVLSENNTDCRLTGNPFEDKTTLNLINGLLNNPTRQQNSHTYNIMNDVVENRKVSAAGTDQVQSDSTIEKDSGISAGTLLSNVVMSDNSDFVPGMQTKAVRDLLSTPSIFNTFTDIPEFYTQREIPIRSIVNNLKDKESFQMTVEASTNPAHLSSCFESIEQTELLKKVLGKV